jgi:hypothetical protein
MNTWQLTSSNNPTLSRRLCHRSHLNLNDTRPFRLDAGKMDGGRNVFGLHHGGFRHAILAAALANTLSPQITTISLYFM